LVGTESHWFGIIYKINVSFIPFFLFWFWFSFDSKVPKVWKYHEIFVYILQVKGVKMEKNRKKITQLNVTKIPNTKRQKYGMNEIKVYNHWMHNLIIFYPPKVKEVEFAKTKQIFVIYLSLECTSMKVYHIARQITLHSVQWPLLGKK
jgi:hypothetical protein